MVEYWTGQIESAYSAIMTTIAARIIDTLVPFGILLRTSKELRPFERWGEILWRFLPQTFFVFWLFTFIPFGGGFIYMLALVPLSVKLNSYASSSGDFQKFAHELLVYYVVILIGFGGFWSFVGHTFMADTIAAEIGWETGSPFQTELAFYTLGTAVTALLAVWIRGHLITALVFSKSIFWYGAAYVHIQDAILNENYAPLNIGTPLIGDLLYPTLLLALLAKVHRT